MSGSALLSIGTTALFANYSAIQTTGHNIANANTEGYSRQEVELETAGGQFTGAGFFGKGVVVTTVARAHDDFLTRQVSLTQAQSSADAARMEQLKQLESVFATGEAGIGFSAGQFLNSFVDVANNPQDLSARSVTLGDAQDLALRFRTAGQQIDNLQSNVASDIRTAVSTVNTLAKNVADLNSQIALSRGSSATPNDLLDQRDQLIKRLSEYIQVTTVAAGDGSTSVFVGGGQTLVLGGNAATLTAMQDNFNPAMVQVGLQTGAVSQALPSSLITGGSLSGLLRFQNDDLVDARNQLGQMAQALAGKINQQQALGLDLTPPAGQPGAPIFDTGTTSVLASNTNAVDGFGNPVASYINGSGVRVPSVSFTITNASQLQASDYLVAPDAATAGNYLVTRLSDNKVVSVASGATVDGFQLSVVAPLPAAGDKFLLRPVAGAALNMSCVLDNPKGIAAASPFIANAGANNAGTLAVTNAIATSAAANPTLDATVNFVSVNPATGVYTVQVLDSGAVVVPGSPTTWQAGQTLTFNGWQLSLSGAPLAGDTIDVKHTVFPGTNNANARALVDLRDAAMVGQASGGGGGATITDAYANAMTDVGVRVNGAKAAADMSSSIALSAQEALSNKTGVNLDEEAARLMQYQQSYQAAARVLQVAQKVFDSLLSAAGAG